MTELSPAAQAVLKAACIHHGLFNEEIVQRRRMVAAVLRAAADHVHDHQMSAHMLYAIADELENFNCPVTLAEVMERARAALAEPEPEGPTPQPADDEVAELVAWFRREAELNTYSAPTEARKHRQAADLLERLSPPQPVPVSERLQQIEDLAADAVGALRYIEQSHGRLYGVGWDRVYEKADRLRPAHALPLPS